MSFSCNIDILQIAPVVSPFCLPHYKPGEGRLTEGEKKTKKHTSHQVRLHCLVDGTICKSVLSASRFRKNSLERNVFRPPNHRASFILPQMPFNFIIMTADTYTHAFFVSICLSHTHQFMMMDISLLNEEWEAWRAI